MCLVRFAVNLDFIHDEPESGQLLVNLAYSLVVELVTTRHAALLGRIRSAIKNARDLKRGLVTANATTGEMLISREI